MDRRKSVEDAKETVELAETYMKNPGDRKVKVVGIDLSGNPSVSYYAAVMCESYWPHLL